MKYVSHLDYVLTCFRFVNKDDVIRRLALFGRRKNGGGEGVRYVHGPTNCKVLRNSLLKT